MEKKNVLLIAGGGTLGTYASEELLRLGHSVDVICLEDKISDNENLTFCKSYATNEFLEELFSKKHYDGIINFIHYPDADKYKPVHKLLTDNTDHLIFLSSYRAYADLQNPITESAPFLLDVSTDEKFLAEEDYALSKAKAEKFIREESGTKNWTIVRPVISFSDKRLDIVTINRQVVLEGKPVILPKNVKNLTAGLDWSGNTGKIIANLLFKEHTLGEAYTISSAQNLTWGEVAQLYTELAGTEFKWIEKEEWLRHEEYIQNSYWAAVYDRFCDRKIDNRKVLDATGLKKEDFKSIKEGLKIEIAKAKLLEDKMNKTDNGCDFIIDINENRKLRLLQLTDMQIIDSTQKRTPERLGEAATDAWLPENFDALCGNHIRSLVAQTNPDLIFITGDIIYGSFDDTGTSFEWFCNFMDSLEIPWAPAFGNHDNESKKGVDWQCSQFEKSKWCVFKRGNVTGNSNFTVGISSKGELRAVLHLLDTNACIYERGLYPDQLEMVRANAMKIEENFGRKVPAFLGLHIPTTEFVDAEISKGYKTDTREVYTIGVDVEKKDGDFGCKKQGMKLPVKAENFLEIMKESNVKAVFTGHFHYINTVIEYEGIKWVFGFKTGQYDNHIPGHTGGTLLSVDGDDFEVCHIPSLAPYGKYPKGAPMFNDFFCE